MRERRVERLRTDGLGSMERPAFLISTSGFIRDYLERHGEGYPWEMFRELKREKRTLEIKVGTYQNLRNYIWWLRELGLIELSREEPSKRPGFQPRRFYRLTKKGVDLGSYSPEWRNPRRRLYPHSWKK